MDPTKLPHSMNPLPSDRFMPNLPTLTKADSTEVGTLLSTTCTDVLLHKSVKKMQEESRGQHCIVLSTIGNQAEADPTENPSQPKRKRKPDLIDDFFKRFVCGRLAQLYPDLVTLIKENEYLVLKFNDIDKIGSSYCDFKELTTGKELRRKPERTKDRFRRFMKDLENKGLLEKVGDGKEYGKLFLKYAVKKTELWDLLKEKYTVQENATMIPESPPVTNNVISNEASPYTKGIDFSSPASKPAKVLCKENTSSGLPKINCDTSTTNVNPFCQMCTDSLEVTTSPCVNVPQEVKVGGREQCLLPCTKDVPVCNDLVDLSNEVDK